MNVNNEEMLKKSKKEIELQNKSIVSNKKRIDLYLTKLKNYKSKNQLEKVSFLIFKDTIERSLKDIEQIYKKIQETLIEYGIDELDPDYFDSEIDSQAEYIFAINQEVDSYDPYHEVNQECNLNKPSSSTHYNLSALKIPVFEGEIDSLKFPYFLCSFLATIELQAHLSEAAKLVYLRSSLRGYSFKIIEHLPINDDNFEYALKLLRNEFLDAQFLADEIYKKVIKLQPPFDTTYNSTKEYIDEVRGLLYTLRLLGFDYLDETSDGFHLMSSIIFSKLPKGFRKLLIQKVNSNYPTLFDIFTNSHFILNMISSPKNN